MRHLLLLALLGATCLPGRRSSESPQEQALAAADLLLDGSAAGVDAHLDATLYVLADAPRSQEALQRLAHGFVLKALVTPKGARSELLEQGREYGLRCLATNIGFRSRREVAAGRITADAAAQLTAADLPCLDATLEAWVYWVAERGPAAALDLRAIGLLAERRHSIMPSWRSHWAQGMVLALDPRTSDLEAAGELLRQAVSAQPELALLHADHVEYYLLPAKGEDAARAGAREFLQLHPAGRDSAWPIENQAARQHMQLLLER